MDGSDGSRVYDAFRVDGARSSKTGGSGRLLETKGDGNVGCNGFFRHDLLGSFIQQV